MLCFSIPQVCYVPTVLLLGKKEEDTPEKPVQSDESEAEEEITLRRWVI